MMKRWIAVVAAAASVVVPLEAQSPSCPGATPQAIITQDACQQAIDVFNYLAPQLGTAITGGNATLGQGGPLGGFGHFSVGARVNAVAGSLPQVQQLPPRATGALPGRQFPTNDDPIPMPAVDAAVGVFRGIPLALTNVGGIDLLVSATYVPKVTRDNVTIDPRSSLQLGYGARLGILQESLIVPGVAFTYLKRDLPTVNITGTSNGATLFVNDATVKTDAWRLVANKSLILFGLAAGVGGDRYRSSASGSATTLGQTSSTIALTQTMTRTSVFGDVSANLLLLKFVGEIGLVSGGDAPATVNSFEGKGIVDSRLYGSIGLRFGW